MQSGASSRSGACVAVVVLFLGMAAPAASIAQQTDANGQIVNPQPHTKQQYNQEKKDEKRELKHNQKADKAQGKANRDSAKAARHQRKANAEADKANTPQH